MLRRRIEEIFAPDFVSTFWFESGRGASAQGSHLVTRWKLQRFEVEILGPIGDSDLPNRFPRPTRFRVRLFQADPYRDTKHPRDKGHLGRMRLRFSLSIDFSAPHGNLEVHSPISPELALRLLRQVVSVLSDGSPRGPLDSDEVSRLSRAPISTLSLKSGVYENALTNGAKSYLLSRAEHLPYEQPPTEEFGQGATEKVAVEPSREPAPSPLSNAPFRTSTEVVAETQRVAQDLLRQLVAAENEIELTRARMNEIAMHARELKVTWSAIGAVLGITEASARQRFSATARVAHRVKQARYRQERADDAKD